MSQVTIPIKLSAEAKPPIRKTTGAAGYDLCAVEAITLPARERETIATGLSVAVPQGLYLRIAPRSGLAARNGIDVLAGVVDSDYRGELKVILINHSNWPVHIAKGDAIAQAIIERCYDVAWVQLDELPQTERGHGGFGSTGR